jgi:hypothetical protein
VYYGIQILSPDWYYAATAVICGAIAMSIDLRRLRDDRRDGAVDLARGPLVAVRVEHARERAHDLAEHPERGALAVRQGTTLQSAPIATAVEVAGQLRHQPRLADSGDSDEGEELRLELALDPIDRPSEQRELPLATHERRVARSPAGAADSRRAAVLTLSPRRCGRPCRSLHRA